MSASARPSRRACLSLLLGGAAGLALPRGARGDTELAPLGPVDHPGPALHGESLRWEVRYRGVSAGEAWAWAEPGPEGSTRWTGRLRNAPWYGPVYRIDDLVQSEAFADRGSRRYRTRYRETGFSQDQDMRLWERPWRIHRRQLRRGEWEEWWSEEPVHEGAEDPVSALVRVRFLAGEGPWRFPVFSGRHTWPAEVRLLGRETVESALVGTVPTRVLAVDTRHEGEVEQRGEFHVWLGDDARRLPLRMRVRTSVGPFVAELVDYQEPGSPPVTEWSPDEGQIGG